MQTFNRRVTVWFVAGWLIAGTLFAAAVITAQRTEAQSDVCRVTEALGDDQFTCQRDGKSYRMLPPPKLRELAQQKVDLQEKTALLENANQQIATQHQALDAVRPALQSCSDLTGKLDTFITNEHRRDEQFNVTLNRFDVAQQRQTEALDAATAALRPGRVRQFMDSPYMDLTNRYFLQPALSGIWARINGCK